MSTSASRAARRSAAAAPRKARATVPGPAKHEPTTVRFMPPGEAFARLDSQLGRLADPTNPVQAWAAFGATRESVYKALRQEPTGALEVMAQNAAMGHKLPRSYTDQAKQREILANYIADRMANLHENTPMPSGYRFKPNRASGGARKTAAKVAKAAAIQAAPPTPRRAPATPPAAPPAQTRPVGPESARTGFTHAPPKYSAEYMAYLYAGIPREVPQAQLTQADAHNYKIALAGERARAKGNPVYQHVVSQFAQRHGHADIAAFHVTSRAVTPIRVILTRPRGEVGSRLSVIVNSTGRALPDLSNIALTADATAALLRQFADTQANARQMQSKMRAAQQNAPRGMHGETL